MEVRGEFLISGSEESPLRLILAHGAGAPMNAPFMIQMADKIAAAGFQVVLFEFDYMKRMRTEQKRRPPDRPEKLLARWRQVIDQWGGKPLVLGGKSMGGRIASVLLANDPALAVGLVCLGYPFHPPARPEVLRIEHLYNLKVPTLICQGERDPFGGPEEVAKMALPENIEVHWLADGGHGFKPRVASGLTEEGNITSAAEQVCRFLKGL